MLLLGLPWESPSHKMQADVGRQKRGGGGVMVPGVSCVESGNWGRQCDSPGFVNNIIYKLLFLGSSHIQRCRSFSERVVPQIILLENLTQKQTMMLSRTPQMLKKNQESSKTELRR